MTFAPKTKVNTEGQTKAVWYKMAVFGENGKIVQPCLFPAATIAKLEAAHALKVQAAQLQSEAFKDVLANAQRYAFNGARILHDGDALVVGDNFGAISVMSASPRARSVKGAVTMLKG
jgi:hypothetical protein